MADLGRWLNEDYRIPESHDPVDPQSLGGDVVAASSGGERVVAQLAVLGGARPRGSPELQDRGPWIGSELAHQLADRTLQRLADSVRRRWRAL